MAVLTLRRHIGANRAKGMTKLEGQNVFWDAPKKNFFLKNQLPAAKKTGIFGAPQQSFLSLLFCQGCNVI